MMLILMDVWDSVRGFMASGGDVLWLVAAVLFLMWVLMLERYWYLNWISPKQHQAVIASWEAREETT
jgi:biopolymer transport protein ExbB